MNKQSLILGTAQLMDNYGLNKSLILDMEFESMLDIAKNNNIEYLDTAFEYKNVHKKLGQHNLDCFKIITKIPKINSTNTKFIHNEVNEIIEKSLFQLKIDKIDTLLIHNINDIEDYDKCSRIIDVLRNLKISNLINKIGFSIYSPKTMDNFKKLPSIDLVQAPLNLIDQNLITSGYLQKLKTEKIEVNIRSIFLQGLLLISNKEYLNNNFSNWSKTWEKWFKFIDERKPTISPLKVCLDFVRNIRGIDKIVVGCNSYKEFKQILNIMNSEKTFDFPNIKLNDEELIYPYNWKLND